ncbi:family 43 glycosylhydrolase [Gilvimarinus sp. DA14]|uniref:family 43 glycosylhydrolase n=1 Tax=Gilvimarinus sp. DA14 TaxID=2956798 RepID=UPI0020B6F6BB|nr:family 43 glycosylhydrolase [Gilvimarinus sp. DA14]UTF59941.1 family 43 glycosylhydrolase [Gilvimarinus sp. DA14]
MNKTICLVIWIFLLSACAQVTPSGTDKIADKPLYRDATYDGAADPLVIWNHQEERWFMFYTNRRASILQDSSAEDNSVAWVHGTPIGIAESTDGGATWSYRADANINYGGDEVTYWAPEVIHHDGTYHMYLTIVPGIFNDWNHPRNIVHLTSQNLLDWEFQSELPLVHNKVIDASVYQLPNGHWRLWYNNEKDGKSIYYADSPDLYQWQDKGKIGADVVSRGEGPTVFEWQDRYFMIIDEWKGLAVYHSTNLVDWQRQPQRILATPGTGPEDGVKGQHAHVVVNNDRAYIFYFVHAGQAADNKNASAYEQARTLIQVAELQYVDGEIVVDRNAPVKINLTAP